MNITIKGINPVTKRLSDGTWVTYRYAWKGGPPLTGEPGSPEFIASYLEAIKGGVPLSLKKLSDITKLYQRSEYFKTLKPTTRYNNARLFRNINDKLGELPTRALEDPKAIDVLEAWR